MLCTLLMGAAVSVAGCAVDAEEELDGESAQDQGTPQDSSIAEVSQRLLDRIPPARSYAITEVPGTAVIVRPLTGGQGEAVQAMAAVYFDPGQKAGAGAGWRGELLIAWRQGATGRFGRIDKQLLRAGTFSEAGEMGGSIAPVWNVAVSWKDEHGQDLPAPKLKLFRTVSGSHHLYEMQMSGWQEKR